MNKGLESWKEVKAYLNYVLYDIRETEALNCTSTGGYLQPFIDNVETALIQAKKDKKELEEIKSAINQGAMISQWSHDYQHEKELKALEIIKEKNVNTFYLKHSNSVEEYNIGLDLPRMWQLTQEEYDLLKEVLL